MAKAKKKTLPKDFEALLAQADLAVLQGVFDGCVGTPLHAAADSKQADHAATLLAHGAQVDARNREGLTPLELALRGCSNIEIERTLTLARVLLDAGAVRTPATGYVEQIGKRFEFHRAGSAKDSVAAVSAALDELYVLFGVAPVARRELHDGRTAIAVKASAWQDQREEPWALLVPSSGPALTVQGEAIRVSGRLSHEILDNGGANWDDDFRTMARALLAYVQTGTPLDGPEVARVRDAVDEILDRGDGETAPLAEMAVAWVLRNPDPVPLAKPAYRR